MGMANNDHHNDNDNDDFSADDLLAALAADPWADTDAQSLADYWADRDAADALAAWNASADLVTYSANHNDVIRDTRRATMAPGVMPD